MTTLEERKQTIGYRKSELSKVAVNDMEYKRNIKIVSINGETKFFNITDKEFKAIYKILTKE